MKGLGFVGMFFFMIVMVGMFSLLWIALDQGHQEFLSFAESNVDRASNVEAVSLVNILWIYIPGGVMFSFLVWGINRARRDRDQLL